MKSDPLSQSLPYVLCCHYQGYHSGIPSLIPAPTPTPPQLHNWPAFFLFLYSSLIYYISTTKVSPPSIFSSSSSLPCPTLVGNMNDSVLFSLKDILQLSAQLFNFYLF